MNFSDRGLSFKRYFFVIFYRHLRIGFWCQTSKMCAIVVINGNYMMQGSLIVAGHKFVGQAENTELSETSEMSEMSETSEKISEMSEMSEKISEMSEMSEKISEMSEKI